jgi:uncharacterized protein YggT (Ycf19 family)
MNNTIKIVIAWSIVMGIIIAIPIAVLADMLIGDFESQEFAETLAQICDKMVIFFKSPAFQIPVIAGQVGILILVFILFRDDG